MYGNANNNLNGKYKPLKGAKLSALLYCRSSSKIKVSIYYKNTFSSTDKCRDIRIDYKHKNVGSIKK